MSSSQVSDEQKANLQEVADLMLQIYQTLAEMRYLDPKTIIPGPHTIPNIDGLNIELDSSILYLYSILPYINEEFCRSDFFHGGSFADFRIPDCIQRGRDPFYCDPQGDFEEESGQYMRPWATPLSVLGNHGTVIVYDAKLHRIWAIDQEGWGTTDPALVNERMLEGTAYEKQKSDWGSEGSEGEYVDEDDEDVRDGSNSEFWSDESELSDAEIELLREDQGNGEGDYDEGFEFLDRDEQREAEEATRSKNEHSFEHIPSRPAGEFLRSIIQWYRELKEVPGQGEYSGSEWMEPKILRPLYLRNGWPDNFDGDAFEVDQARAYCANRAKYHAEEPLRKVECYEGWSKYFDRDIEKANQELKAAQSEDDEWKARYDIWNAEGRKAKNVRQIMEAKAKAEQRCPGGVCQREEDLPLWEMEMLRVASMGKHEAAKTSQEHERSKKQKEAAVYTKAYEASVEDAKRLCPGKTFEQVSGIKSLGHQDSRADIEDSRKWIARTEARIQKLRNWAEQLPDGAVMARKAVDEDIEKSEKSLEDQQKRLEGQEKWLAELGNVTPSGRKATGGIAPRRKKA